MAQKIVIREVATYHPEQKVSNEFYIEHFKEQEQDITHFLEVIGRENRYIADQAENSLTMALKASIRVLEIANLKGEDLDMIVFASSSPEYLAPPNAVIIHNAIHGKLDTISYDTSVGCIGMVMAVDQVSRNMMTNPHLKRALVVGADQYQRFARKEDPATYASFGDAAAAVILEKQENTNSGFIDSHFYTDSETVNDVQFPACGLSKLYQDDVDDYEKRLKWVITGGSSVPLASSSIHTLLKRNQLTLDDIKVFCLSQVSKKNILRIKDDLGQPEDKFVLVGHEFGYTLASSPFVSLDRAITEGKLQRGDYVMFWSVGAGLIGGSMLFKY